MLRLAGRFLAIATLLFGCIVGPETHVHPGEGPHSEALVHTHAGIGGHTHNNRQGLSESGEGPATYINAYSFTPCHAPQIPIQSNVSTILALFVPEFAFDRVPVRSFSDAHAPPGVEFGHLRAPPLVLPV